MLNARPKILNRRPWSHIHFRTVRITSAALLIATPTKTISNITVFSQAPPWTRNATDRSIREFFLPSLLPSLLIDFFNADFFESRIPSVVLDVFPARGQEQKTNSFAGTCKQAQIHQHLNMESGRGTDFPTIAVVDGSTIHLNGFITLQNLAKQGEVVEGCGCQTGSSDYEHKRVTKGLDEWKFNVVTVQPSIIIKHQC